MLEQKLKLASESQLSSTDSPAETDNYKLPQSPLTAGHIRCTSCGEDRLIEWDEVLKVWSCAVCGRDWREVKRGDD